jgi:pimeloyl-ACP methyl ester carboxylesterase
MAQMIKSDYFNSGNNRLSYACTIPAEHTKKAGVIFVHAAEGNRLGPHRMFVEIAEELKNCGIISLRFDMRGCGDSEGDPSINNINPDIEDLFNAINFFVSTYKTQKTFLFGISKGALVCISTLMTYDLPISGAILLSTPFGGSKMAARKFNNCLKEYLYKLTNFEYIKKLLSGKANIKQISKTLIYAITSPKRYRHQNNGFATKCSLNFIYGAKDPITTDSSKHYRTICEKNDISFTIQEILNANHSFFHYIWKEQIIEISKKWLMTIIYGD